MTSTKSSLVQELSNFYEALCLDLPVEATKTLLGVDNEKDLRKAGWKAYDAWISVANELANRAYSSRLIGEITGRTMDSALRFRQLGATIASAFFGNLWPAVGLPTQDQLLMVREELLALREELAAREAIGNSSAPQRPAADVNTDERLRAAWKRLREEGYQVNGSAGVLRRARERKGHAAA